MLRIKRFYIIITTYIYLALPVLIFLLGWIRLPYAILAVTALLVGIIYSLKHEYMNNRNAYIYIHWKWLVFIAVFLFVFAIISGVGGFYYQSRDFNWRNAIFNDLIKFEWPVIYNKTNTALVYYFAYWLPAALIGKLFGRTAADIALLNYTFIGLLIVFFLMYMLLKINKFSQILILMSVFLLFSGLDVLGAQFAEILLGTPYYFIPNHLEWWTWSREYSSNMTQLMWVFNQSLMSWITIALLLLQKKPNNFAVIGILLLASGPIPFIGFFPYAVVLAIKYVIKNKKSLPMSKIIKNIMSLQNVLFGVIVFPIVYFFLTSNTIVQEKGFQLVSLQFNAIYIFFFVMFIVLEVLVYLIPLLLCNKKDVILILTGVLLCIIPFFKLGADEDFIMKASVPALFILMIYLVKFFIGKKDLNKKNRVIELILIIAFTIGTLTPIVEQTRALKEIVSAKNITRVQDNIVTFSDMDEEDGNNNFLSRNYFQNIFFEYFIKD